MSRSRVSLAALTVLGTALSACMATPPQPAPETRSPAQRQLDALPVSPADTSGYSAAAFGQGWDPQPAAGKHCDTRSVVLRLADPLARFGAHCTPETGHWPSYYTQTTETDPSQVTIDHVVSLKDAWASGARTWSPQQRHAFANDLTTPELAPVSKRVAQQKNGAAADTWRPPHPGAWCRYATEQTQAKEAAHLSVTEPEKRALADMLTHC